jgi:hypothetical protein
MREIAAELLDVTSTNAARLDAQEGIVRADTGAWKLLQLELLITWLNGCDHVLHRIPSLSATAALPAKEVAAPIPNRQLPHPADVQEYRPAAW